ncbi:MAG: TetR/AcrR family transcriptional regulator [Caulobacteraceae bacterium]|nr:TetR/AcrR family transcriptional regulator [Caulobacteraceae bacterium]
MNDLSLTRAPSPRLDQIVNAARTLFVRYGCRRTAMEDIAREAGLAKATLYLHFAGKEEVFRAMVERCRSTIAERCDQAEALQAPLAERLAALLDAHYGTALEWFGDASSHMAELQAFLREEGDGVAQRGELDFENRLDRFLAAAAARGEINFSRGGVSPEGVRDVLRHAAWGAKHNRGQTPERFRAALADISALVLAGLAAV